MQRHRLDKSLVSHGLVATRSQAESWIKLGRVTVNGRVETKPGFAVPTGARLQLAADEQYVSRAGLKLASVASLLGVDFRGAVVLDVGSSTGGFTDYALQHGARKVVAVDVGSDQLHPSLRGHPKIELHEKTDIRDVEPLLPPSQLQAAARRSLPSGPASTSAPSSEKYPSDISSEAGTAPRAVTRLLEYPDIVVIDVSFISLREILPHIHTLVGGAPRAGRQAPAVVAMVKPQFEAGRQQVHKGVIKNDAVRRQILRDFEAWVKAYFAVQAKQDSEVAGSKGNRERFYLLRPVR